MSRVIGPVTLAGRSALLSEVSARLEQGGSLALHGPSGIGKSALLDAVEQCWRDAHPDGAVLRSTGAADEHALPFATLRDLTGQLPPEAVATLPEGIRGWIDGGLVGRASSESFRSDLCAAFHASLAVWVAQRPVLLLLDDVQWLDADSSCVVGYVRRRLAGRLVVVATVGPGEKPAGVDIAGLHPVEVGPLERGAMIDLLASHGLPADVAQRVHVESGGLPSLALALAGAISERPSVLGRPTPLPSSIERVLRERLDSEDPEVRATLVCSALLHRPGLSQLERAGRHEAEAHLRRAAELGMVVLDDTAVRFTPPALRQVVLDATPAQQRLALHLRLSEAAANAPERLRHLALAASGPDADLAAQLGGEAATAAGTGSHEMAAELFHLAARRAPLELAEDRVEWLVLAVEQAATANHVEIARAALDELALARTTPAQAVRIRLAVPELAGAWLAELEEVLAAALADAGEDDRLVARVLLLRGRVAQMESRPALAAARAERAAELFERVGDPADRGELAESLTLLAAARRWQGRDFATPLARAAELSGPAPRGLVHTSPAYLSARFALYDDRLEDAWEAFHALLAQVESEAGTDQVHLLRCLVEVAVRMGRCREASEYAGRAERVGQRFGLDAHTGWFISALAELAGGDLSLARTLAERGAAAAAERGDTRYLQRHLLVLGQALLRSGDAEGARDALSRIRTIERAQGVADPTINRWQPELGSALVLLGELDEARALLDETRTALEGRSGTAGVGAVLDRVEGELLMATGDLEEVTGLLERSAEVTARTGMWVEHGRTLVVRAHLERRRRRAAAARAFLQTALALFVRLHALAWAEQVRRELDPEPAGRGVPVPGLDRLTDAEGRVARAVAAGASNRQIAEQMFLSVKTVEATLTRIYRKLGVRSRTQLAATLAPRVSGDHHPRT